MMPRMESEMSLLRTFERYPLTFGPTPIEHLPRLSKALGNNVQIYAKATIAIRGSPWAAIS